MKYLILFVSLLGLAGCSKRLDMILPFEEERFVIYGELNPNEVIHIKVDKTYPPTGKVTLSTGFLDSTKVGMFEDDVKLEELVRVPGTLYFRSSQSFRPKEGKSYHFVFSHPHIPTAISEPQVIPEPLKIMRGEISSENVTSSLNPGRPARRITLELEINQHYGHFSVESKGFYKNREVDAAVMVPSAVPAEFDDPCLYHHNGSLTLYNSLCNTKTINGIIEIEGSIQTGPNVYNSERVICDRWNLKLSYVPQVYVDLYRNLSPPEGIEKAFFSMGRPPGNIRNGYGAITSKYPTELNLEIP